MSLRSNSVTLSHPIRFVKNFFQVFSNFFVCFFTSSLPRRQLRYISILFAFCQHLFSIFLRKFGVPFDTPNQILYSLASTLSSLITSHHRSGHSRHLYDDRQQQRSHCYPHPGKQRSHAPADSSEGLLLHGSWV